MRTSAATRPLTFRAPIGNEGERAHFQARMALTGLVVFVLSFGFLLAMVASVAVFLPTALPGLVRERSTHVHAATSAGAFAVWIVVRAGKRSANLLGVLDLALATWSCAGWSAMALAGIPLEQRPEMIALLACTFTLVLRAALVPSTPMRTAVLGAIGFTILGVLTSSLYASLPLAPKQLPPAVDVGMWGAVAVATTTVISHVIYGLRQEVRKAMQLGQYLLEEKIGEGGMGVVYRASHAMLRRPTAIKLLNGTTAHAAERFEREVQITARLTHPNTVAVFDYGRTPDGIFYYAMEYLEGISLEDLVAEHGPQSPRRVAHILVQMCGALHEAHAAGLVHRDIKPANAMLTERGGVPDVVKVLDFGLVKEMAGVTPAASSPAVSMVNTIMGTPHYMAPETILDPASIDARADLYAVGATAYFLLTGEPVFDGTNLIEICSRHLHDAPSAPSARASEVPASLDRLVLACLAKKPADRPPDAGVLASMVLACGLGEWTASDARDWWAARAQASPKVSFKARHTNVSAFGNTLAVTLDGREAG